MGPLESLPAELRERRQWLAWDFKTPKGADKPTKVPRGSTTNPRSWMPYSMAAALAKRYRADGVGFVFTADDPYVGIDLDGCVADGKIHPAAQAVIDQLGSWHELSPSGTGVHVIVRGEIPDDRGICGTGPWGGAVEVYSDGRYFTMNGGGQGEIRAAQPALDAIARKCFDDHRTNGARSFDDHRTNGAGSRPPFELPETVPLGQRHNFRVRYAGWLASQGADECEIERALSEYAEADGHEPPDGEIEGIAEWVLRKESQSEAAVAEAAASGLDGIQPAPHWLDGTPMDPLGVSADPLPTVAGFPMVHAGMYAEFSGPTGGGRSETVQAGLYEAAVVGVPSLYLGHEITESEYRARARRLADLRGDEIDDELRSALEIARYVDLSDAIAHAWEHPDEWCAGIAARYAIVVIDPLSAAASALELDFERSNTEYERFYDRLILPLVKRGVSVLGLDNTGHEARSRSKGASSKRNRADLSFSAVTIKEPLGLRIKCEKTRSTRCAFKVGDTWTRFADRPGFESDDTRPFRPTYLMEQISLTVEAEPEISATDLRDQIKGKGQYIVQARELLINEGYIEMHGNGRKAHVSLKPYRQADDPALAVHGDVWNRCEAPTI